MKVTRYIHKLIPQTLLFRFLLIITIPTILAQTVAVYLFYDRHWYNVAHHTSDLIANEIVLVVRAMEQNDQNTVRLLERSLNLNYVYYPQAALPEVKPLSTEELDILREILEEKLHSQVSVYLSPDGSKIMIALAMKSGVAHIQLPAKVLVNPTTDIFVLWIFSLTMVLLFVSIIFSKNQIKSIISLANAADQFGKGTHGADDFKPSGASEIRMAGIAFMKMRDRLEKQIKKRTQMLAMISHDLRTPITRIKLQLELMDNTDELHDIASDVSSMEQMISSYLDFTRGEGGEEVQKIDLFDWINRNINAIKPQNLDVKIGKMTNQIFANLKPQTFRRALANILSNAAKYATIVSIVIYKSKTKDVLIEIEDNGVGISDEEKALVFKPFYRSDKARTIDEHTGSVGLGLAITKEIITGHNGTISLHSSKNLGGLLVRITLPNPNH